MIYMKRVFIGLILLMGSVLASAQTSESFERKYNMLTQQLGPAGLGVETVLNAWEKVDSTNVNMLLGRFRYYLAKGQSTEVVSKYEKRYLGMDPILKLTDSLNREVYYYQETSYDDELFGLAMKPMDKAISLYPERLDLRVLKANVYMTYEKGSPEMTSAYLKSLATEGAARKEDWNFEGEMKDKEFFKDAMQEYCFSIYQIGTPQARKVFYELSQHLYKLFPDRIDFLNNVGSYYLVTEDFKAALKVYSKVLKKYPDNLVAIQNSVLASRMLKDPKLEVKYLQMMVKYAPQREALLAKSRMEALTKK